jgi:hypothetical protein
MGFKLVFEELEIGRGLEDAAGKRTAGVTETTWF